MSIGEEFTLCGGGGEVCGVNAGPEEGQVLVSFTNGSVQLYSVSGRPMNILFLPLPNYLAIVSEKTCGKGMIFSKK